MLYPHRLSILLFLFLDLKLYANAIYLFFILPDYIGPQYSLLLFQLIFFSKTLDQILKLLYFKNLIPASFNFLFSSSVHLLHVYFIFNFYRCSFNCFILFDWGNYIFFVFNYKCFNNSLLYQVFL
jgi:hypothetical protein